LFWGQLTFLSDSDFLHEIVSRDERYEACCDNDLLHAGSDSSIENAGGTRHSALKPVVFSVREHENPDTGIVNTNLEDNLRFGGIGERGCNMHDGINAWDVLRFRK
jgi:hypothetical protein